MREPYSHRLGVIADSQFQAALDRFGLGRLLGTERVRHGLFAQNVFLRTTSGEWVFRGDPHFPWQFPKEQYFARLIHERTSVPAPWPYLIDEHSDIFGWSYALMPRLPGVQISDPDTLEELSRGAVLQAYAALGRGLADLHAASWPHPGQFALEHGTIVPLDEPYADWTVNGIRRVANECLDYTDRTTREDVEWVEALILDAEEALAVPFAPSIVHHDFSAYNTVQEQTAAGWRVSGIFDLVEAFLGDGERDLARQIALLDEDDECSSAFVRGYATARPLRVGARERALIYMLDDRLVVWEFAQRMQTHWFDPSLTLREWAEPYLERAARLVEEAITPRE